MSSVLPPDPQSSVAAGAAINAKIIAALFATVFDLEAVAVDDDFFRLGGDSLTGAELMTGIEKRFGLVLSLSTLLEAPTPRALAEAIYKTNVARVARCMISINPGGAPPPIFCVHGNEGESTAPQRLSKVLGARAFYAFRALGLEQGEEYLNSVDAIAANYLSGLRQAHPKGPHVLFGHCAGTMIAYEMAQQLAAAGNRPAALVLADPEVRKDLAPYLYTSGLALSLMQSSLRKRAAELDEVQRSEPNPTGEARRKLVHGGIKHAIGTYIPKQYDGPTLLIYTPARKAALLQKDRGFPALVSNLETLQLSTYHKGMFKEGLSQVAEAIGSFIDRHAE